MTVTYDVSNDIPLKCISIAGSLSFRNDISTRLKVETLLVLDTGTLQVGTAAAPIAAGATAEIVIDDRPIDTQFDPEQFGTGIIGFGRIVLHGAPKQPTFLRLNSEVTAGAATLVTATAPTGWTAGEALVLPDTRHLTSTQEGVNYSPQWEELYLSGVNGNQLALAAPTRFAHVGARDASGALRRLPHVANLSRNVIIRSANPNGTRGHAVFIGRADVDIRYALFHGLGRTTVQPLDNTTFGPGGGVTHIGQNQIGRYPIHMHHVAGPTTTPANGYQFTLVGNAIWNATKWGLAIHNSHYGLVEGNVVYDAQGASIVTEDGSESFNVIASNIAVRSFGTGGRFGDGREGNGFWFKGPNNYVRGNVAANHLSDGPDAAYGYKYAMTQLGNIRVPVRKGADTSVSGDYTIKDGNSLPLLQFEDNEAYGATASALSYFWLNYGFFGFGLNLQPTIIKNFTAWHVHNKGIFHYEASKVIFDGLLILGKDPGSSACCSTGYDGADYMADAVHFRNSTIEGMGTGIRPSTMTAGMYRIENSTLKNLRNINLLTLWTSSYRSDELRPRTIVVTNVQFGAPAGASSSQAITYVYNGTPVRALVLTDRVFVYDFNGVVGDNFQYFFAEQHPDFIVPKTILNPDATTHLLGSPVAGLNNRDNWAAYQVAIAGAVTPCLTQRAQVAGFVCPLSASPPPPFPVAAPQPPSNLKVIR